MNEKFLIEQLEHDVDHLLDGRTPSDTERLGKEYRQLVETAQLLARHDLSTESRIQKTLRQKLLLRISNQRKEWSPKEKGNRLMKTRTKNFIYAGVIAIILLMAAALPPVQALAQEILNHVGPFVVIPQKLPLETPAANFNPTPISGDPTQAPENGSGYASNGPTPIPPDPNVRILTAKEALDQFGFKVLTPVYLPEGFTLIDAPNNNVVFVGPGYINSSMAYTTVDGADLQIAQSTFNQQDQIPFHVGDVNVTQIKVRGKDAVFVKDAIMGIWVDENGQDIPVSYLMWEEDDLFFMIQASKLPQDEMVKIAEALK